MLDLQPGLVVGVQGDDLLAPAGKLVILVVELDVGVNEFVQVLSPGAVSLRRLEIMFHLDDGGIDIQELGKLLDVPLRSAGLVAGAGDYLALGVHEDYRRKALDLIFF